jgi:hypothetical protein
MRNIEPNLIKKKERSKRGIVRDRPESNHEETLIKQGNDESEQIEKSGPRTPAAVRRHNGSPAPIAVAMHPKKGNPEEDFPSPQDRSRRAAIIPPCETEDPSDARDLPSGRGYGRD